MAAMTVWKFGSATGAEEASKTLRELQKEQLITIYGAATVSWSASASKPKTKQLHHLAAGGALGGGFWGLLFGMIFFVPLLGAAIGALAGSLSDVGIDDDFIRKTQDEVVPGTSALFLLTSEAVLDRIEERFAGGHFELIRTNLSNEQEKALRDVFEDSQAG